MNTNEDQTDIENEILRLAVPNISGLDLINGGNLSSLEDLDLLLFHINSSQLINQAYSPSTISLHIILTLATRLPQLNWSRESHEHDIVKLVVEQEAVHGYTSMIPFKDRAHRILSVYLEYLQQLTENNEDLQNSQLYEQLQTIFIEMISQQKVKRKFKKTHRRKESSEHEIIVISDSEEDITLKPVTKHPSLRNEQSSPTRAMKNAQILMDGFGDSKTRKKKKKEDPTQNTKLFDDNLITHKLDPSLNNGYSLWHLIEWTFWCSKRSKIEEISKDIFLDSFHESYVNYRRFVSWCFDFFILDLNNITRPFIDQLKPTNLNFDTSDLRIDKTMIKEKNLLSLLIGYKSGGDRYTDIVDTVFFGLLEGERVNRNPVYLRERQLLDEVYFTRMGGLNRDQQDSMDLRVKILFSIYQASTYYSSDSITRQYMNVDVNVSFENRIENDHSTYSLIHIVADKLSSMKSTVVELFFDAVFQLALEENCSVHSMEFLLMTLTFMDSDSEKETDVEKTYELLIKISQAINGNIPKVKEKISDLLETKIIEQSQVDYLMLIQKIEQLIDM